MNPNLKNLLEAQGKAIQFFNLIEEKGLIVHGKTEKQLNTEINELAKKQFKIEKFWHKRIVRAGKNSLLHYRYNPPDLTIEEDDILFFDYGPVFDNWEADLGRTYVLGNDEKKLKLKNDIEIAWQEGQEFYNKNKMDISGSDLYNFTKEMAARYGWEYDTPHCGHLVAEFHHEQVLGDGIANYIHPDNLELMINKDIFENERHWIYEIHFIDKKLEIGGFFEQLLIN